MAATPDTSVVVAGLSAWHPDHDAARGILQEHPRVVSHVLAESYSVLTRLPQPRRLRPDLVIAALFAAFPEPPIILEAPAMRSLLERLASKGVVGGSTYDALVGETARQHGYIMASLDRRARVTYEAVGVSVMFIA